MASQNPNNQEETTIDKVNSQLTQAGTHIANNKKIIFWAVGAIAVAAAFTVGYLFIYKNPHVQKGFDNYNRVELTSMGNDSIAAEQYMKVADDFKGDTAGKLAALAAAEALYNEGRYEEAVKYLDRFSSKDDVLEANATVLKGDCYVNLGNYDEALKVYAKAIAKADRNPQIVPRVLLKEANVYDEQKKYDKALECYRTIKESYPEFRLGNGLDLDAYIAREEARMAN